MAANGRPTPHADSGPERPRFRPRPAVEHTHLDANPYLQGHRSYGHPLIPAEEAWPLRGKWHHHFGRSAPLHLEIGSGNGFFLSKLAQRHPEWNVLGLEIRYKRTVLCARKLDKLGVTNARILRYHAAFLDDLFEPGALAGIYVNHPDPWPRVRQRKHRLISRWFLEDVSRLLAPGGWLRLKSDFAPNIERVPSLLDTDGYHVAQPLLPLEVTGVCHDLVHDTPPWPDDIETNYQSKFRRKGLPVHAIELRRTAGAWPVSDEDGKNA